MAGRNASAREVRREAVEAARAQKERARQDAWRAAQCEVEEFEQAVGRLRTIHARARSPIHWGRLAVTLPPPEPARSAKHELAALLQVARATLAGGGPTADPEVLLAAGRLADGKAEALNRAEQERQVRAGSATRALARRIIAGDAAAYREALASHSALARMELVGSAVSCTVHSRHVIEAQVTVNSRDVLPPQVKSLTATGKVTAKAWAQGPRHELYQDYVCVSAIRVAREIFAVLPVRTVLVTAFVPEAREDRGGEATPVLSVIFDREALEALDCATVDPSDAAATFRNRGDVKASRKTGQFTAVQPFTIAECSAEAKMGQDLRALCEQVRAWRQEIAPSLKSEAISSDDANPLENEL